MGPKNQILKQGDRAFSFLIHSSRRDSHFSVFVCQNWMKNGQVITNKRQTSRVPASDG